MRLSVLFIPFDAAIQHYERNANLGVTGYTMQQDVEGNKRRRDENEKETVEPPGKMYEFQPTKKKKQEEEESTKASTSASATTSTTTGPPRSRSWSPSSSTCASRFSATSR